MPPAQRPQDPDEEMRFTLDVADLEDILWHVDNPAIERWMGSTQVEAAEVLAGTISRAAVLSSISLSALRQLATDTADPGCFPDAVQWDVLKTLRIIRLRPVLPDDLAILAPECADAPDRGRAEWETTLATVVTRLARREIERRERDDQLELLTWVLAREMLEDSGVLPGDDRRDLLAWVKQFATNHLGENTGYQALLDSVAARSAEDTPPLSDVRRERLELALRALCTSTGQPMPGDRHPPAGRRSVADRLGGDSRRLIRVAAEAADACTDPADHSLRTWYRAVASTAGQAVAGCDPGSLVLAAAVSPEDRPALLLAGLAAFRAIRLPHVPMDAATRGARTVAAHLSPDESALTGRMLERVTNAVTVGRDHFRELAGRGCPFDPDACRRMQQSLVDPEADATLVAEAFTTLYGLPALASADGRAAVSALAAEYADTPWADLVINVVLAHSAADALPALEQRPLRREDGVPLIGTLDSGLIAEATTRLATVGDYRSGTLSRWTAVLGDLGRSGLIDAAVVSDAEDRLLGLALSVPDTRRADVLASLGDALETRGDDSPGNAGLAALVARARGDGARTARILATEGPRTGDRPVADDVVQRLTPIPRRGDVPGPAVDPWVAVWSDGRHRGSVGRDLLTMARAECTRAGAGGTGAPPARLGGTSLRAALRRGVAAVRRTPAVARTSRPEVHDLK